MKNLTLTIAFVLISLFGISQTSIGPIVGYNAAEVIESQKALHGDCLLRNIIRNKSGYYRNSLIFGMRVKHIINKRINLGFISSFTSKVLSDDCCRSFDLKYRIINLESMLNVKLYKSFDIGIGANLNYLFNFNYKDDLVNLTENHFGFILSSSYYYKNLIFDIKYKQLKNLKLESYWLIKSSKSFEFSISYMFESNFHNN